MCGRFEILTYEEVATVVAAIEGRTASRAVSHDEPRTQARPGSNVLLFDNSLHIAEAQWGFTPEWGTKPVFNTRIETALEGKGMWRKPIQEGRCIVPAAAFYEPHATETIRSPRTGRPMKRQYRFASANDEPLLLAGVQAEGHCSVVTCEPNRWVLPIHNRMPLLLRFEEVLTWLSANWPSLSDRSDFALLSAPEHPDIPAEPDQLSLF